MGTITKKDLVDRIANQTDLKRSEVRDVIQSFLDNVINELGDGNRLEFRDFGVFEIRERAARMAAWVGLIQPITRLPRWQRVVSAHVMPASPDPKPCL